MQSTTTDFATDPYTRYYTIVRKLARKAYSKKLLGVCDQSDIAQSVMMGLIRRNKCPDRPPEVTEGWLRKAVQNKIVDKIRQFFGRNEQNPGIVEPYDDCQPNRRVYDDPTPSELAVVREHVDDLSKFVAQLPSDQAEAVTLHHLNGKSLAATANLMGRTEPAVAGLLRRGFERLRELMNGQG